MSRAAGRFVQAFAVLGLAAALAALFARYRLILDPSHASFCDISQAVNCTRAYLSRYGSIAGAPTPLYGVLWFMFVALLAALTGRRAEPGGARLSTVLLAASLVPVPLVAYQAHVALVVLRVLCLTCVATWVAVLAIAATAWAACGRPAGSLAARFGEDVRALLSDRLAAGVVLAYVAGALALVVLFPREPVAPVSAARRPVASLSELARRQFESWYEALPKAAVPVSPEGAAVVILKFTDLQCPGCALTHVGYRTVLAGYQRRFPGAVRLVVKDYPLEPECNASVPRPLHPSACDAAAAVRLAARQGRREALEDWFYQNQALLRPESVREAAARIGGVPDFERQYPGALAEVKADAELGTRLGVSATPSFFINGRTIPPSRNLTAQQLDWAIELELRQAGRLE